VQLGRGSKMSPKFRCCQIKKRLIFLFSHFRESWGVIGGALLKEVIGGKSGKRGLECKTDHYKELYSGLGWGKKRGVSLPGDEPPPSQETARLGRLKRTYTTCSRRTTGSSHSLGGTKGGETPGKLKVAKDYS